RLKTRSGSETELQGKAAIAGAATAYGRVLEIRNSARWKAVAEKGAREQRLLWASTGTKNPKYSDVLYVESLIAPDTIATVPPETLRLFEDHGRIQRTLDDRAIAEGRNVQDALTHAGIDM